MPVQIRVFPQMISVGENKDEKVKVMVFSDELSSVEVYVPDEGVDQLVQALKGSNIKIAKSMTEVEMGYKPPTGD
jgi:predicted HAD superfamily phosphohydrolase YqeG